MKASNIFLTHGLLELIKMSEEPDVGNYEEYVLSGIEDQASEEVAQKYEEIEKGTHNVVKCSCDLGSARSFQFGSHTRRAVHRDYCEISKSKKQKAEEPNYDGYDDDGEIP